MKNEQRYRLVSDWDGDETYYMIPEELFGDFKEWTNSLSITTTEDLELGRVFAPMQINNPEFITFTNPKESEE